ncbi:MAG: hypothetical protein ACI9F9_002129 [Candidatus Paceibacteria bacterium]
MLGRVDLPPIPGKEDREALFLSGLIDSEGLLELHTIADELDLEQWNMPALPAFDALRSMHPKGRVGLYTTGSVQLLGDLAPRGEVRFRVHDGSLSVSQSPLPIVNLALAFQASFEPSPEQDFWSAAAWHGGGQLQATWDGQQLMAGARVGQAARKGLALESWLQAPNLLVNTPGLLAMEAPDVLPTLFSSLDPEGHADFLFGLRIPDPAGEQTAGVEFTLSVEGISPVSAAYHGWPDPRTPDVDPLAFALPATLDQAQVLFARTPRFTRPALLDVRFAGSHPTGPVSGSFQLWPNPIDMPPFAKGYGLSESDLFIHVPRLELDASVRQALQGLHTLKQVMQLYETYGIEGGHVAADLRLSSRRELELPALEILVDLEEVNATFIELPVPAKQVKGRVRVVDGGLGKSAVSFDVSGTTASSRSLHLSGRVRAEAEKAADPIRPTRFEVMELEVERIDLQGTDVQVLGETMPDVAEAIGEFAPRGKAHLDLVRTRKAPGDVLTWTEITPKGSSFEVQPRAFPMRSQGVRGRVLVEGWNSPPPIPGEPQQAPRSRTRTSVSPLLAHWGSSGVPVGFHAVFETDRESGGTVLGASIESEDRQLLADILRSAQIAPAPILAGTRNLAMGGAVDFDYRFQLPVDGGPAETAYDIFMRDLDLVGEEGVDISKTRGELLYEQGRITSKGITAFVGGTPLSFSNLEITETQAGLRLDADLDEQRLEVTPSLLAQVLAPDLAEILYSEFEMRGTLDVEVGHLVLHVPSVDPIRLEMQGEATLSDASMTAGVPVTVRSARIQLEQLVLEREELRAWGRIEDLYGQVLGRDLAQTDLLLSYHDSQITVEQLQGLFCRGTLSGLGSSVQGQVGAPAISLDLLPPYRFRTGLKLSDVDVRLLLEGVFASGIADRGLFDAQFQLDGDLENLFDIQGSGRGKVSQTILWSVPVLRALFSQLGLDETAIFDEMESEFRVANGAIQMEGMGVHSPLLQLRGAGTMGFDGTLNHDLEVRYSLVDKAGFFGEIIHWLQNRLLAISIRGDMSRPQVVLRGVFSNPFTSVEDNWRALPAPGYSRLPARF